MHQETALIAPQKFHFSLREHQVACIQAIIRARESGRKRILVKAPCAFGKTVVFSYIAYELARQGKTALILQDSIALCEYSYQEITKSLPLSKVGIYCAGLKKSDVRGITVSTIQSFRKRPDDFDYVIVDEAHDSLNQTSLFMEGKTGLVIGFTATPYTAKGMAIYGEDKFYESLCYEMPVGDMVKNQFLTPMVYGAPVDPTVNFDTEGMALRDGDFKELDLISMVSRQKDKVELQIKDMLSRIRARKKVIIICVSIDHCNHVASMLTDSAAYHSKVSTDKRRDILSDFRSGKIRFLVGVMAIYKGIDVPAVDCLVNMRPTRSYCLYTQFAGRGVRVSEGKVDCLFLDYGETVLHLGFYEDFKEKQFSTKKGSIAPEFYPKKCLHCGMFSIPQARKCSTCNTDFPFDVLKNITVSSFLSPARRDDSHDFSPKESTVLSVEVTTSFSGMRVIAFEIDNPEVVPRGVRTKEGKLLLYYNCKIKWMLYKFQNDLRIIKTGSKIKWKINDKYFVVVIS